MRRLTKSKPEVVTMTRRILAASLLGWITVAAGCASTTATRNVRDPAAQMPEWYLAPPSDQDYLLVASTATSRDLQMAVDKASQAGRAEMSSVFDNRMKRLFEQLRKETGKSEDPSYRVMANDISKSVVSDILLGSRVRQQKICTEGAVYRAYVLMEMPLEDANDALISHIRSRERNHGELQSSEAFRDLEDEVRAYEEWRRAGALPESPAAEVPGVAPPPRAGEPSGSAPSAGPQQRPFERRRR
jgi:hypothetical protein